MDKIISIAVTLIAVVMLLAAGGVTLGAALDTWAVPVLVAVVAIDLLAKTFKK